MVHLSSHAEFIYKNVLWISRIYHMRKLHFVEPVFSVDLHAFIFEYAFISVSDIDCY